VGVYSALKPLVGFQGEGGKEWGEEDRREREGEKLAKVGLSHCLGRTDTNINVM